MSQGLELALIHNGELESAPAAITAEEVQHLVGEMGWSFTRTEVCEQPPLPEPGSVPPGARKELLRFAIDQRTLEHRFRANLEVNSIGRDMQAALGLIRDIARLTYSPIVAKQIRIRRIETFVTRKHVLAAEAFLEGNEPLLLVAESDATWLESSRRDLKGLLEAAWPQAQLDIGLYVNLAGGLDPKVIGLDETAATTVRQGIVAYQGPSSNTSCAYLIDRRMAQDLVRCSREGDNLDLGVDWLFNFLFLTIPDQAHIWHCSPPILGHGSIIGTVPSWHPDR